MKKDQCKISMEKIFDAVRKCRGGVVSEELAGTLDKAGLLRGVMHIGSAPRMRIVFASALKDKWQEAEKYIRDKLPPQASLRYTASFNVDFIISGQLPDDWAHEQIAKKAELFDDLYEAEVSAVKRYRWAKTKKSCTSRTKAKLQPSLTDIANFLKEKQTTRLVYDSARLPSLSCLALITISGKDLEYIWDKLDEQDQRPVRDIFINHGDKARLDSNIIDRDVRASGYAFCEFDIGMAKENGSFKPAMNQAYEWRRSMVSRQYQNFIQQVRMMPCAVMSESIDYYDELDEINSRMKRFEPTVTLPYRARGDAVDQEQISLPIWNLVICGGQGSGKSVYAYMVLGALLKDQAFDVVYVNYKDSDETQNIVSHPRKEAMEFAKIIGHLAQRGISLTRSDKLENAISDQPANQAGAWYTECAKNDRVETVLQSIRRGREKRVQQNPRGLFVFFDEILNQKKNLRADMANLLTFANEKRSSSCFLGVIHQELADFWKDDSASSLIERSTVVLGSSLTEKDEKYYQSLSARADRSPLPVWPVTFAEVRGFQRHEGRFVFLPSQEHALRHTIPDYAFLKTPGPLPEEWEWGVTAQPFTSH